MHLVTTVSSLSLLSCLALSAVGCGNAAIGHDSPSAMAAAIFKALDTADPQDAEALYWPADDARDACSVDPAATDALLERNAELQALAASEPGVTCPKQGWKGVKVLAIRGGEPRGPVDGCGGAATALTDLELDVSILGYTSMTVRALNPVKVGGGYFLMTGVRCDGVPFQLQ